jgi:hypothetical protein
MFKIKRFFFHASKINLILLYSIKPMSDTLKFEFNDKLKLLKVSDMKLKA